MAMLRPPDIAQPVPCRNFGSYHLGSGGCSSMQLAYSLQLQEKQAQMAVINAPFTSGERAAPATLHHIIGCTNTLYYRNKMEFSFGCKFHLSKPAESPENGDASGRPAAQPLRDNVTVPPKQADFTLGLHAPGRFDKIIEINECHLHPPVCDDILQEIRDAAADMLLEPYDSRKNVGYFRNVALRVSTNAAGRRELMVNLITSACDVPDRLVPLAWY